MLFLKKLNSAICLYDCVGTSMDPVSAPYQFFYLEFYFNVYYKVVERVYRQRNHEVNLYITDQTDSDGRNVQLFSPNVCSQKVSLYYVWNGMFKRIIIISWIWGSHSTDYAQYYLPSQM
jgi:hypothetical protein